MMVLRSNARAANRVQYLSAARERYQRALSLERGAPSAEAPVRDLLEAATLRAEAEHCLCLVVADKYLESNAPGGFVSRRAQAANEAAQARQMLVRLAEQVDLGPDADALWRLFSSDTATYPLEGPLLAHLEATRRRVAEPGEPNTLHLAQNLPYEAGLTLELRAQLDRDAVYIPPGGKMTRNRTLEDYYDIFPGLEAALDALPITGSWLDIGAGVQRAQLDFNLARGSDAVRAIGIDLVDSPQFADLRAAHGVELVVSDLNSFAATTAPASFDVVTELYAAGSYEKDIQAFVDSGARTLKVGGDWFLHFAAGRHRADNIVIGANGERIPLADWLASIDGLEEVSRKTDVEGKLSLHLRKTKETIVAPAVKLIGVTPGGPPLRVWRSAPGNG